MSKKLIQAASGAGGESVYVEDVFSTYLYDGNSSTQTITNDIDLSGEGGAVWLKSRNVSSSHVLVDTERGASYAHFPDLTIAQQTIYPYISSFNSNGFTLGNMSATNDSSYNYVSWTFRKARKFFDVVTYTGTGSAQTIAHNLGSVPGMIIVKGLDIIENWIVYHSSLGETKYIQLNATGAAGTSSIAWNDTAPTSTEFTVNTFNAVNESGYSYVAYLFASDAGGFGDDGSESIIKCGSYTTDANEDATINLGWEPQWLLVKRTDSSTAGDWRVIDSMRGWEAGGDAAYVEANTSDAEAQTGDGRYYLTSTGFKQDNFGANRDYIYIAIRRPMKTPESGTEVFNAVARTGTGAVAQVNAGFAVDLSISSERGTVYVGDKLFFDKLRGANARLTSTSTSAESSSATDMLTAFTNTGVTLGADSNWYINKSGNDYINWYFKRATGFFDVVAYTGDGTADRPVAHNLGVVPTLRITKQRTSGGYASWWVYYIDSGGTQTRATLTQSPFYSNTDVVSTAQYIYPDVNVTNDSGDEYITYLFASLDGISKISTYTGNGGSADINVDCGFASGARFVLIKSKTESTNWLVWDSVRGIVAGNDPYLQLNSTATEVTTNDYIDPYSAGFTVTTNAPTSGTYSLNASGVEYVFLAIA